MAADLMVTHALHVRHPLHAFQIINSGREEGQYKGNLGGMLLLKKDTVSQWIFRVKNLSSKEKIHPETMQIEK
ncbi:hypothetical protein GDO81_020885 [Engystomops pustulosus]|uniref:Uncharacterized protein n=1 Tax=Engystomops pustulosus TaxID=76066 RepID=A0AAV6YWW8_ENGPU|nr:hypothetical protein GDO81_020885 [Engystomops pustulosus]